MSSKINLRFTDDLIREALHLEMECIESPPVGKAWRSIESNLDKPQSPIQRYNFTWSRLAAVAAACLIIMLGSVGIYQAVQFSVPVADSKMGSGSTDEALAPQVSDEMKEFSVAKEVDQRVYGETDPLPLDWPSILPGDYYFGEAILLNTAGAPFYHGAFYHSSGEGELLLVKSTMADQEITIFLEHLGRHLQVTLSDLEETDGFTCFTVGELQGMAWFRSGYSHALLVLSGFIPTEELKSIAIWVD